MGMQLVVDDLETFGAVMLPSGPLPEPEFLAFCEHYPDYRIEYDVEAEELIVMLPTAMGTGFRNNDISAQLRNWARRDGRGRVADSSTLFLLPNGSRLSPDASWILKSRLVGLKMEKDLLWPEFVPDFIIELRSRSDSRTKLEKKMKQWIDNGVKLAWLVDPYKQTVDIYRPGRQPEVVTGASRIDGVGPVKGFVLDLSDVWQ